MSKSASNLCSPRLVPQLLDNLQLSTISSNITHQPNGRRNSLDYCYSKFQNPPHAFVMAVDRREGCLCGHPLHVVVMQDSCQFNNSIMPSLGCKLLPYFVKSCCKYRHDLIDRDCV